MKLKYVQIVTFLLIGSVTCPNRHQNPNRKQMRLKPKTYAPKPEIENRCAHIRYPEFNVTLQLKPRLKHSCSICRQVTRLGYLKLIPYSEKGGPANKKIRGILQACCAHCGGMRYREQFLVYQMKAGTLGYALMKKDIVYPVLAYAKSTKLYGGYFIPIYTPSGGIYITKKQELDLGKVISACSSLWPLLAIGIPMVMIAGFIGWLLDCRSNKEEFPRDFVRGWWEGIWWSFVTMSTVGYGDKSPKSIPARLFAIVWIYIGIVLCGILVASLTTIIIDSTTEKKPSMDKAEVGMLQNRIYDSYLIAQNGGNKRTPQFCWEVTSSIFYMLEQVKEGKLDGFLLDKQTYWKWTSLFGVDGKTYMEGDYEDVNATTCEQLRNIVLELSKIKWKNGKIKNKWVEKQFKDCWPLRYEQCRKDLIQYFLDKTVKQDVPHTGDEMAFGIWMKHHNQYNYFRDAFVGNQINLKSELALPKVDNTESGEDSSNGNSSVINNYKTLFTVNGAILGVIIFFGIMLELVKKGIARKKGKKAEKHKTKACHHL